MYSEMHQKLGGLMVGIQIFIVKFFQLCYMFESVYNKKNGNNEVPLHSSQDGCYPKVYKQ